MIPCCVWYIAILPVETTSPSLLSSMAPPDGLMSGTVWDSLVSSMAEIVRPKKVPSMISDTTCTRCRRRPHPQQNNASQRHHTGQRAVPQHAWRCRRRERWMAGRHGVGTDTQRQLRRMVPCPATARPRAKSTDNADAESHAVETFAGLRLLQRLDGRNQLLVVHRSCHRPKSVRRNSGGQARRGAVQQTWGGVPATETERCEELGGRRSLRIYIAWLSPSLLRSSSRSLDWTLRSGIDCQRAGPSATVGGGQSLARRGGGLE